MTLHIRAMTPAYLPQVLASWDHVPEVELNDADAPEKLTAYLERDPGLSPVATTTDELVGAACAHDGRRGYLRHLVATGYRRKGVGKALAAHCMTRLSELGIVRCNIFAFNNHAGLVIWQRLQFQEKPWKILQGNNDGA